MPDPATLSNRQLLQLVGEKDNELATKDNELATHTRTIAQQSDIIKQLEAKLEAKEKAYLKLWLERFAAKSERYIADPDQLRMDFGDTAESADAAAGLAEAVEEAGLVSAHRRQKRKQRDESLPDHLPREVILVEPDDTAKICGTHGGKTLLPESMWAYRGERVKLNVFDFTVSRHRDGPAAFFENYTGTILGDCWHGFGAIAAESDGEIVRAACNAHARRKFDEAMDYPADRRKWMGWYTELYDINTREQNLSSEEKLKLRQSAARAVWDQMRTELESVGDRTEQVVLPKSDFRKALNYLANHWTELTRYLNGVEIPIDNNQCEQLMKQIGLGRKNWLFCGSVAGGERNAGFMTLVSSAHRNDLDVWAYVNDVLKSLLAGQTD